MQTLSWRKTWKSDWEEATEEMEMAIIDGSSKRRNRRPQDWCLREIRERFSMTMGSRVAETAMLTDDAKLGESFLCWGETVLLLRSLTGLQHSKKKLEGSLV